MVDTFARPVVLLNLDDEGHAQGSARSVAGLSIHQALCHCQSVLTRFGGHARAAGMKLDASNVDEFRQMLVDHVNSQLGVDDLVHELTIDATCDLNEVSVGLIRHLDRLAPFGSDNRRPVLCARQVVLERPAQRMGRQGRSPETVVTPGPTAHRRGGVQ